MNSPAKKPFNFLDKIKSESISDKDFEVFNRIERKFTPRVTTKISSVLTQYRNDAVTMSSQEIFLEKHSAKALGRFLRVTGIGRPAPRWEAHHLISGSSGYALQARAILADDDIRIRIDDPDNGCWMPKTKVDARPTLYPNAIGHSRIHRKVYYHWIQNKIAMMTTAGQVRAFLNTVRAQLLQGNIRPEMKLQAEIDEAEYLAWLKKNP